MQTEHVFTTPFGRRAVSLAMLTSQVGARDVKADASVDKWKLFRSLCDVRSRLGVSDRSLLVLNALLSFYPGSELCVGQGHVVFPSNERLSQRAHGMAPATLRRHLAALVEAGLIIRKDSANGKRFSRKIRSGQNDEEQGAGGDVGASGREAFGLSILPLIARADEIELYAQELRAEQGRVRALRYRLTLMRRDLAKLILFGRDANPEHDWDASDRLIHDALDGVARQSNEQMLLATLSSLDRVHLDVSKFLEIKINSDKLSAKESQFERHIQKSNIDSPIVFEPSFDKSKGDQMAVDPSNCDLATSRCKPNNDISERTIDGEHATRPVPLPLVLQACPDIVDYAKDGIRSWRDLMAAAIVVRSMLGVSPSAYEDACLAFGQERAAVVMACILQRAAHINSAGGYLRSLTDKARNEVFSVWPMLMTQLRVNGEHLKLINGGQ